MQSPPTIRVLLKLIKGSISVIAILSILVVVHSLTVRAADGFRNCGSTRVARCAVRRPLSEWDGNRPIVITPRTTKLLESPKQIKWRDVGENYEFRIDSEAGEILVRREGLDSNSLTLNIELEPGIYLAIVKTEGHDSRREFFDATFRIVSPEERDRIIGQLEAISDPWEQATLLASQGFLDRAIGLLKPLQTTDSYLLLAEIFNAQGLPEEALQYAELALEGTLWRKERQEAERIRDWAKRSMRLGG